MIWAFVHGFLLGVTYAILAYSIIEAVKMERKR